MSLHGDDNSLLVSRFEQAINSVKHPIYVFDQTRTLVLVNTPLLRLLNVDNQRHILGCSFVDFVARIAQKLGPLESASSRQDGLVLLAALPEKTTQNLVFQSGTVLHVIHTPTAEGGFVHTLEDVTAKRKAEAKASHLAAHDALTNLPNRRLMKQHIDVNLSETQPGCAVLCVNLDRFKSVNDRLGHAGGDALLVEVSQRLQRCVRELDTVGRLGGDEFVILLSGASTREQVTQIAQRVVAEIGKPFDILGQSVIVGARVGIALAPEDGNTPDRLIKSADMALFEAKKYGRGHICFFEPRFETQVLERQSLEADLRVAVAQKQFELHYQPVFSARHRKLVGFEALIRWNHPTRGRVSPLEFISIAEELGLIIELGDWIIDEACKTAATWPEGLVVAVNVSARQFVNHDLNSVVTQALLRHGLAPARLEIEVTESLLMENDAAIETSLQRLRHQGIGLAMDDFGTGYSSLAYLRRFNFTKVKIDRSFINGLATDAQSIAIVRAILALCKSLHIVVTAEGIETEAQADILRLEQCDYLQGFLLGRPTPTKELLPMFFGREQIGYQETAEKVATA